MSTTSLKKAAPMEHGSARQWRSRLSQKGKQGVGIAAGVNEAGGSERGKREEGGSPFFLDNEEGLEMSDLDVAVEYLRFS